MALDGKATPPPPLGNTLQPPPSRVEFGGLYYNTAHQFGAGFGALKGRGR